MWWPEFSFGVAYHGEIVLSDEHTGYRWLLYQDACEILKYDSNRTALWELNERLGRQKK